MGPDNATFFEEIDHARGVVVADLHALLEHRDRRTIRLNHNRLRAFIFLVGDALVIR